jgi:hypothetical protein
MHYDVPTVLLAFTLICAVLLVWLWPREQTNSHKTTTLIRKGEHS